MRYILFFCFFICLWSLGCVHLHRVQPPAPASEFQDGVRVGIGGPEVKEGDTVDVMKSFCRSVLRGRAGKVSECPLRKIGEAKVIKIIDDKSALVSPLGDLRMDESMRVEKQ